MDSCVAVVADNGIDLALVVVLRDCGAESCWAELVSVYNLFLMPGTGMRQTKIISTTPYVFLFVLVQAIL